MSQRLKVFCKQLRFKSIQLFIVAGSLVLSVLITLLCIGLTVRYELETEVANVADVDYWKDEVSPAQAVWYDRGIQELRQALAMKYAQESPRHVWIVVVNGISAPALAAARYSSHSSSSFVWEQFPHLARLKNSCSYSSPCDPVSIFKALWAGVPLAATSPHVDTNCISNGTQSEQWLSVLRQAQEAGMRTGFVTNQRITGATGAALYAQVAQTNWECDGLMPLGAIERGCEDVARQLINGAAGQALNVIMGGGRQLLSSRVPSYPWDAIDELLCRARTGRNLLRDWQTQRLTQKPRKRFELVQHERELKSINGSNLDYLLGVLANGDLYRNLQAPSLQLMLNKSLEVLKRPDMGHLLVVEHLVAEHMNATEQLKLLNETLAGLVGHQRDLLTVVMITNGNYLSSRRDVSEEAELITTLTEALAEGQDEHQLQQRLQQLPTESLLFAQGPKSFLFSGLHEETYLAHVLAHVIGSGVKQKI